MDNKGKQVEPEFEFTEIGKLRHENDYLQTRVKNLEGFKTNFFRQKEELKQLSDHVQMLEQQLGLDAVRKSILKNNAASDQSAEAISRFLFESLHAQTVEDIVLLIFQAMSGVLDNSTIIFRQQDEAIGFDMDAAQRDKNRAKLEQFSEAGEIVEEGACLIFNYPNISVLFEAENKDIMQQQREYLHAVVLAANIRVRHLIKQRELEDLRRNSYKIFQRTSQAFESLQDNIADEAIQISEWFLSFENSIQAVLEKVSMSSAKMEALKSTLINAKSELNILLTTTMTLDEDFVKIIKKLEQAYAREFEEAGEEPTE